MTARLLLDEHYSEDIAAALRDEGHDVEAVVADPDLRGADDATLFRSAAQQGRRIVTENVKDFRPLLLQAAAADRPVAALLLVPSRRLPRGRGARNSAIVAALRAWLGQTDVERRPLEDWST